MIAATILALAIVGGLAWWRVLLLALALLAPWLVAALVALLVFASRRTRGNDAAMFCEVVASELRAGASLRDALGAAATATGLPPPRPTTPLESLGSELSSAFGAFGDELRLTIVTAARSGAGAAVAFDELGSLALGQSEIEREVKVATAPGRATGLVLVGAPAIFVASRLLSGGFSMLLSSTQQRVVALAGLGLFVGGLVAATLILWRAQK